MKIEKNIYKSLWIALFCLMLIGCAPKSQVITSEEPQSEYNQQEGTDKQDVLDLAIDSKVIPLENPKHGIISGSTVLIDVETEERDTVFQLVENIPDEIDSLNSQAYRVQIFSSNKFGESKYAKLVAEEIFDRPVFLDYEVPYYKVRVGNFSNREKAEQYQQKVKSSGYKNAWVVVVTVNIKETSLLYDEILIPQYIDSLNGLQEEFKKNDESKDSE